MEKEEEVAADQESEGDGEDPPNPTHTLINDKFERWKEEFLKTISLSTRYSFTLKPVKSGGKNAGKETFDSLWKKGAIRRASRKEIEQNAKDADEPILFDDNLEPMKLLEVDFKDEDVIDTLQGYGVPEKDYGEFVYIEQNCCEPQCNVKGYYLKGLLRKYLDTDIGGKCHACLKPRVLLTETNVEYGGLFEVENAYYQYRTAEFNTKIHPFYTVAINATTAGNKIMRFYNNHYVKNWSSSKKDKESIIDPYFKMYPTSDPAYKPGFYAAKNDNFYGSYHFPNFAKFKEQTNTTKLAENFSLFCIFLIEMAFRQDKLFFYAAGGQSETEIKRKIHARTLTDGHTYSNDIASEMITTVLKNLAGEAAGLNLVIGGTVLDQPKLLSYIHEFLEKQ